MPLKKKCVFCSIVKENKPFHEIIWEDKNHIAFLDAFPVKDGHTLVIPKKHVDYIFDLNNKDYATLWKSASFVAGVIKKTFRAKRVGVVVEGFSMHHTHIHLLPLNRGVPVSRGRRPSNPKRRAQIAEKLRKNLPK